MLIEELIRLGRPVLESGLDPREVLKLITDAGEDRVKNFYRHVIVVELPPRDSDAEPTVLPVQNWQVAQQVVGKKKPEVDVDVERALGSPFTIPSGGSVEHPQGRYGLPVYPMWDLHFRAFRQSVVGVKKFLAGRLERTSRFALDPPLLDGIAEPHELQRWEDDGGALLDPLLLDRVAGCLHAVVSKWYDGSEEWLGVLVLARCGKGEFFAYRHRDSRTHIGASVLRKGAFIEPDCRLTAEVVWAARLEEGAGMGRRLGPCTITGKGEQVVAAYCKAWPWAFPTWSCPVPHGGDTDLLVEGIALSEASYRALTLGANLFYRLTRRLHHVVLPELFAPVENGDRQNAARNRSKFTDIFGSALLLPLRDETLANPADRDEFAHGILAMLDAPKAPEPLADRYLTAVTGFDVMLPEGLNRDEFRLTLVYFSSGGKAADVHLRAYIQDVLPSTARDLRRAVKPCRDDMAKLLGYLSSKASDKRRGYLAACYQSVPYLLARGYGGSQLWATLEHCLHRRPLDADPVVTHVAARIHSVVPRWPRSRFEVIDEVIFLLVCRDFIHRYNREVAEPPKEDAMPMRPWQELIRAYEREPIEAMEFRSVAELGFACGLVVRRFSGWYYATQDKDFLKHRVLTFGTDLGPKDIQRSVTTIRSVAAKFDDLRRRVDFSQLAFYPAEERKQHVGDYQHRLGVVLNAVNSFSGEIDKNRDEFVSGFWSGYCLQGYDRPRAVESAPTKTNGGES